MAHDDDARRLRPHPAGLSSIVGTTLVVLAAFLAGGVDARSSRPAAEGSRVAAPAHRPAARPLPRRAAASAGPSATAVSPDALHDAGDSLAEHCEARGQGTPCGDRAVLVRGATSATASARRLRPRRLRRQRRARRPAPPPVVPRAPPTR